MMHCHNTSHQEAGTMISRCHTLPKAGRSTAWRDTTRTEPQRAVDTIIGLGHSATAQP
jgi:hypothetical protein